MNIDGNVQSLHCLADFTTLFIHQPDSKSDANRLANSGTSLIYREIQMANLAAMLGNQVRQHARTFLVRNTQTVSIGCLPPFSEHHLSNGFVILEAVFLRGEVSKMSSTTL